jgi:hypothetical protein
VQHGPRRGGSQKSPNDLFFNFANPAAARGNPLQGAADQIALARFAAGLQLTAAESGGDAIAIDPAAIVFYGHSQGATHGSLALSYEDRYRATVLSGNGASLIDALLGKTQPVNIAGAIPFVLADPDGKGGLSGGDMHPALSVLQHWIDRSDPLNFARAVGREPPSGHTPKHVFQTYGIADHFSPPSTLATFALAAGLDLVAPHASVTDPEPIGQLNPVASGMNGNAMIGTTAITLGVRQYAPPAGTDGHFVAVAVPDATSDIARFLGASIGASPPPIGP